MRDIHRRHWVSLGLRHGITTDDGQGVEALIDELIERTPAVIAEVQGQLPAWFPQRVAASIFGGLAAAAQRLLV